MAFDKCRRAMSTAVLHFADPIYKVDPPPPLEKRKLGICDPWCQNRLALVLCRLVVPFIQALEAAASIRKLNSPDLRQTDWPFHRSTAEYLLWSAQ